MKTNLAFHHVIFICIVFLIGCDGAHETPDGVDDNGDRVEQAKDPDLLAEIVTGNTGGTAKPEGWQIVDSDQLQFKLAWPDGKELTTYSSEEIDNGDLFFAFAVQDRDEEHQKDYTPQAVANLMEAGFRVGDKKLVSESNETEALFRRDFANQNDELTMAGRIYVSDKKIWSMAVTFKNGRVDDQRIKFFFENCAPTFQ